MADCMSLRIDDGFARPGEASQCDDFYAALLAAHEGLTDVESAALNTRLVLLLGNHIGDLAVIREALAVARVSLSTSTARPAGGAQT